MLNFYSFFCLIFSHHQTSVFSLPAQRSEMVQSSSLPGASAQICSPEPRVTLFNIEWLLESLLQSKKFRQTNIVLDCLQALQQIDIQKYKSINYAKFLHHHFISRELSSESEFKRFKNFSKDLNKSTFYLAIQNTKNKHIKEKLVALEKKAFLYSLEKKNKIQNFFKYLNYFIEQTQESKESKETTMAVMKYEIQRYFKNCENKISELYEINERSIYNFNYFGKFVKYLIKHKLTSSELLTILAPIFTNKKSLVSFLCSLTLASEKYSIFNSASQLQEEDKKQFLAVERKSIGTVCFGDNFNFIYSSYNEAHALYLFDEPQALHEYLSLPTPAATLLQYLSSIKDKLNPLFRDQFIYFENCAIDIVLKKNTSTHKIVKL